MINAKEYALEAHRSTNHYYDTYLPYEFHLRMVVKVCETHKDLIPKVDYDNVLAACWLHDTIEDCRKNYNDIKEATSEYVAEIVRAVTNYSRGRNRKERMPDLCYSDMRDTPYAAFVKLCDRIANVQYSKMTGSSMFDKYKKEQEEFQHKLRVGDNYNSMWDELNGLFATDDKKDCVIPLPAITRVELIDHSPVATSSGKYGRVYSKHDAKNVELSYQDAGRTLKVFIK